MSGDGAPRVSNRSVRAAGARIPSWCGLPTPGVWALRISSPTEGSKSFKIDTKRMYLIGSMVGLDITVPFLPEGVLVGVYHHRSDGQVYVSVTGDTLSELDGQLVSTAEPVAFEGRLVIDSDITVELVRQTKMSVREALRANQTEDEGTRRNTAVNGVGTKRGTPIRGGTPLSGYRPRKREKMDHVVDEGVRRSVRFIDFSSI